MNLNDYKWKNRLLLLFSPAGDDPAYAAQNELIRANAQGLPERDMVLVEVIGEAAVRINGEVQEGQPGSRLREQYQVPQERFAVNLVGKDGTEKHRSTEPVPLEKIYGLVDQMPMRRQEMRDNK